MSNRYSFYVESRGVQFHFNKLDELKEHAKFNNYDIESYDIKLGDHCDSLSDAEYNVFYEISLKSGITDYHLSLSENGKLFDEGEVL